MGREDAGGSLASRMGKTKEIGDRKQPKESTLVTQIDRGGWMLKTTEEGKLRWTKKD